MCACCMHKMLYKSLSYMYVCYKSLEGGVRPAGLGIVINHLTECYVVDVISSSYPHIKLAVEQLELHGIDQSSHLQLTQHTVEL